MEKGKLYEDVLQDMKDSIDKVISGEVKSITLWGVSINLVNKYLQEKHNVEYDSQSYCSNGWQVDWWLKTACKKYILSGGLYEGEIIFGLNKDEEF